MERDDLMKLVMERSKKIFAFILAGIMLAALGGCGFRIPFSGESEASFPAKDSSPISGTPQIENEEITLPCTVKDLIDRRFETDYLFEKGYVKMWHHAEEKRGNYLSMFLILGNRSKYKEQDKISDDDTVVAIMVTQFYNIKFDLNGIHLWQDKEDVLKIAGTPAYEKKIPFDGEYCFYQGNNDLIYRFKFLATDRVEEILFGTKEFMIDEKGQPYTGK